MGAPAEKPPQASDFPRALQKHLKPLLDYIEKTHVEDVKIEFQPNVDPTVNFTRGETGLIMTIVLGTKPC
jgi:hypothetical protein